MPTEFISNYCKSLAGAGYFQLDNGEGRYRELQRQSGPVIYLAIVIDTTELGAGELSELVTELSATLALRCEKVDLKNIFAAYVLVGEKPHPDTDEILARGQSFIEQKVYEVFWAVTVTESGHKLRHNPEQPDELGGMGKALKAKAGYTAELPPRYRNTFMNYIFMGFNGIIFALMGLMLPPDDSLRMVRAGAIVPELVLSQGQFYRLFAAMFLHFDLMHLLANLLGLHIFGSIVERFFGGARYMAVYLLTGLAASCACLLNPHAVSAGASGAVYGMIGVMLTITLRAPHSLGFNLYNALTMVVVGVGMSFVIPNVSYAAHLGGLAAGLAIGLALTQSSCTTKKR